MAKKINQTNVATRRIIEYLTFSAGAFVWRQNVLPIPIVGGGFRSGGKKGVPDIIGILPRTGRFIGVETKKGRDKVNEEQEGFHTQARKLGAVIIVAQGNDADEIFNSFLEQWTIIMK
jgi:hypothetical protein